VKTTIIIGICIVLLFLTGCNAIGLFSVEEVPVEKGNIIIKDGVTFTYKELPIRNWLARTDMFYVDESGCIVMKGNSYVDSTFHEANFMVFTDLDLCAYNYIKMNSSITSITARESISPSSQIKIQDMKYSSGSFDNITKEKYSHNLRFYSNDNRVSWIDDEGQTFDAMCGNLTIHILASGGENGTAYAEFKICGINFGAKNDILPK